MAVEFTTPMDRLTELLPLPIIPTEHTVNPDMHHHFHPRRSPHLQDLGGKAVRSVRLQRVDYKLHHNDYHGAYDGPVLPETDEEKFATVIMAVAGYVPEFGIAFRNHQPVIKRMREEDRQQLQLGGDMCVASLDAVRGFMRQYILSQTVESVNLSNSAIDEFITTKDPARRMLLGHTILAQITCKATEPVEETYWRANRRKLLLPGLPNNVQRFAKTTLGTLRNRNVLVDQLHFKLAA